LHYLVQLPLSEHLFFVLHMMFLREAQLGIANEHGITPLHKACQGSSESVVILLLMSGADVEAATVHKECPIHIACRLGKQRLVEVLISHGANTSTIGPDGNAEETARRNGHDSLAEYIHNLKSQESARRKKKRREERTANGSSGKSARGHHHRHERHGSSSILVAGGASTLPKIIKSSTTSSLHSSSEDLMNQPLKFPHPNAGQSANSSSSNIKVSSSESLIVAIVDDGGGGGGGDKDELAESSATPKSSRHTVVHNHQPSDKSQKPNQTSLRASSDSPLQSPTSQIVEENHGAEKAPGTFPTNSDDLDHHNLEQHPVLTAIYAHQQSVASGEEEDNNNPGGSLRFMTIRTRSAKISSLMKVFQPPGEPLHHMDIAGVHANSTTTTATTTTTTETKHKPVSRGHSPVNSRTHPPSPSSAQQTKNRPSDPTPRSGSLTHNANGSATPSPTPNVGHPTNIANGASSPHVNGSPRSATAAHSPRSASPRAFVSPPTSNNSDQRLSTELEDPIITISTTSTSASTVPANLLGERKTSPVPALKLAPTSPPPAGNRSLSPNKQNRHYYEPPLTAHPSISHGSQNFRERQQGTLSSSSPGTQDFSSPSSLPAHMSGLGTAVMVGLSDDDELPSSTSPRSFLSSRSFSTDQLMSDSASDTMSDTKLPSGRRYGDPSTPTSPRLLRDNKSVNRPSLDRSTSDILSKVKIRSTDNGRTMIGGGGGGGQPQLKSVQRISSTEFGPRSVQRVSKASSKGSRHSKPFTKFLKDVNFDSLIAVQDYSQHSQGIVNVSEAMIIPSGEFHVEYGKSDHTNSSFSSSSSSSAQNSHQLQLQLPQHQRGYTLYSDDTEPTTCHYKVNFFDESAASHSHWNFIAYVELKFHPAPVPMIFSLIIKGLHSVLGLVRTPSGDSTFTLDIGDRKTTSLTAKKLIKLMQDQNDTLKNAKLYPVKDVALSDQLLEFEKAEKNAFKSISSHKIGIVYVKEGQITEEEVLGNKHGSAHFEEFLACIGNKIDLEGWTGFDGGLDTKKDRTGKHSIFATWRDFEIMFHVSTFLPLGSGEEKYVEKKKHIANDMTTIIYLDTHTTAFKPPTLSGDFLHNFIVVHPKDDGKLGIAIATKKGTPEFGPPLPQNGLLPLGATLKEFLLSKIINAERATLLAPMFLTKRRQARQHWLSSMINKYIPSK
jgi:phosphoribosylcarboxyaminoimidazole (NCAIR) mutase